MVNEEVRMAKRYTVLEADMVVRYAMPGRLSKGKLYKGRILATTPGYCWIQPLETPDGDDMMPNHMPETVKDEMIDSVVIDWEKRHGDSN